MFVIGNSWEIDLPECLLKGFSRHTCKNRTQVWGVSPARKVAPGGRKYGRSWAVDTNNMRAGWKDKVKKWLVIIGIGIFFASILWMGISGEKRSRMQVEQQVNDELNSFVRTEWQIPAMQELIEPNLQKVAGTLKIGERPVEGTYSNTISLEASELYEQLTPEDKGYMLMRMSIPFGKRRTSLIEQRLPWADGHDRPWNVTIVVGHTRYVGTGIAGDYKFYDETGQEYTSDELNKRRREREETTSQKSSTNTTPGGTTVELGWHKRAGDTNGHDWAVMSISQKTDIVDAVIRDWKAADFKVNADSNYFIRALNTYYGSSATDDTNLAEAMTMVGLAGGAIKR